VRYIDPTGLFEEDARFTQPTPQEKLARPPVSNRSPLTRGVLGTGAAAVIGTAAKLLQDPANESFVRDLEKDRGGLVNLDTGAVRNLISLNPAAVAETRALIGSKQPVMTRAVVAELTDFGQRNQNNPRTAEMFGPNLVAKIQDFILNGGVVVIPNMPSERMMAIPESKRFDMGDKLIFGTGHRFNLTTITTDSGAKGYINSNRIHDISIQYVPPH
jgi:hypothetical protein